MASGARAAEHAGPLVLGLDVGGSTSRALLATAAGERIGEGRTGGGNPLSRGIGPAVAAVGAAVAEALAGVDPARVRSVAVGMAGGAGLDSESEAAVAFRGMWAAAGVTCPVTQVGDALVAFTAGTAEPDGSLLISGTGAVAISVAGRRLATRADGHGWLLGDRGSGFWLGREAVMAALAELDGHGPPTALTGLVVRSLPGLRPDAATEDLVVAVAEQKPVALAALAPTVTEACALGDPVALRIAEAAAEHLLATLGAVRPSDAATPIVVGGSILINDTPVAAAVRSGVARLWPDAELRTATDGAAGAAWLAALALAGGTSFDVRETHARLIGNTPCAV